MAMAIVSCRREMDNKTDSEKNLACNKTYNTSDVLNPFGTLIRTTCTAGPGTDAPNVPITEAGVNSLLVYKSSSIAARIKTKSAHFWFYGTDSRQLFKPTTYDRIFVFDENDPKVQQAKSQVQGGNHYLGFDRGVFNGVYPYAVVNISHKTNKDGKVSSSFNLEHEVKKALPVGKRIFIQFIVQNSPTTPTPSGFENAKYAYCDFVNNDDNALPHYKIDLSDSNLGYQGKPFTILDNSLSYKDRYMRSLLLAISL